MALRVTHLTENLLSSSGCAASEGAARIIRLVNNSVHLINLTFTDPASCIFSTSVNIFFIVRNSNYQVFDLALNDQAVE